MFRTLLATSVVVAVACGGKPPVKPELAASGPRLPPPLTIDPRLRGASYLTALGSQIQPAWGQFLEDCRLRLPRTHPLNQPGLTAVAELTISRTGKLDVRIADGSGNGEYDTAVFDVLADASPMPAPPPELISDDELVHVRWLFARDGRQGGPATAQIVDLRLPLLVIVDKLIARKDLPRAIARVAAAPADPDRTGATERVMIETLREAMHSSDGAARRAAVEAIARAGVHSLASDVHALAGPIPDRDLRLVAIAASAQLADPAAVNVLVADLGSDLPNRPRIALAKIEALATLGRGDLAIPAIRAELAKGPTAIGLAAIALVPDPEIAPKLGSWLANTDPTIRAAVCAALPVAAPENASKWITRGLRDGDATVRARCVDAIARGGARGAASDRAILRRLHELALDRDRAVRARAIAALGLVEPGHRLRAIDDPSAAVRAASVIGAAENDLRTLAGDSDPDVRAAALGALGDRAPELADRAVTDLSAAVRKAAVAGLTDPATLARLANDDSPDVATAALVRLATLRGRAAVTDSLLANLVANPPAPARVRIALAWLLAR